MQPEFLRLMSKLQGSRSSKATNHKKLLFDYSFVEMLPPMKGMKAGAKVMSKGALAAALAEEHGLKKSVCSKMIGSFAVIATKGVKSAGKFIIPGVCQIKTRQKPATKAGKRVIFGKEVVVKAKPAKTIVKAYPVAALKRSI